MDKKKNLVRSGTVVSLILTVFYVTALVGMGAGKTFTFFSNGDNPITISFLKLNTVRLLRWGAICLASLAVTVGLFFRGWNKKGLCWVILALAVMLFVFEIITFGTPFWRRFSIWLGQVHLDRNPKFELHWDFMCTINLIVTLLRGFVSFVSLKLLKNS